MRKYALEAGFALALLFTPDSIPSRSGCWAGPLLGSVTLWVALPTTPPPRCSAKSTPHTSGLPVLTGVFFSLTVVLLPLPLHPPRFLLWGPGWQLSASPHLRQRHAITGPQPLGSGCHLERETRFTQGLFLGQASQPGARPYQAQASSPEEGLQARAPSSGCQTAWRTQTYSLVLRWKEKWGAV